MMKVSFLFLLSQWNKRCDFEVVFQRYGSVVQR